MRQSRTIWKYEVNQADKIARSLVKAENADLGWKTILAPSVMFGYVRFGKSLNQTRENLLFTKKMAFHAAKEVYRGSDRAHELGLIVMKTRKILDRGKRGLYTEKIRRRQMNEIEWLIDHYLRLLNSNGETCEERIKDAYSTKRKFLAFLNRLHKLEQDVIQGIIEAVRKGTGKDRLKMYEKVRIVSEKVRAVEADRIFK